MKKFILLSFILVGISGVFAQSAVHKQDLPAEPQPVMELKTLLDTISYIIGTDVAFTLKNQGMELDAAAFSRGFSDAWLGVDTVFSISEAEAIMVKYGADMHEKRQQEIAEKDAEIITAQKKFLEENKLKDGVITTASGLQYEIMREGAGERPQPNSIVKVHYKGMLIDGTVFDSSYDRQAPNSFDLAQLIPGFTEGIQLMHVGSQYKFYIPADLVYGSREVGVIPAHATIIFEVELLEIEKDTE
ncbi:MAG TPA: FKBP-type peptidyl-prolyl cis-trans isomerase [Bacteroidales bacterium]|nr:FKBP-type peptidyl-prolyl cis-trans isomerase [Bacteroidales bacterium]